jgi:hypothetical protein
MPMQKVTSTNPARSALTSGFGVGADGTDSVNADDERPDVAWSCSIADLEPVQQRPGVGVYGEALGLCSRRPERGQMPLSACCRSLGDGQAA